MGPRRMPGGQRPVRRPGQPVRGTGARPARATPRELTPAAARAASGSRPGAGRRTGSTGTAKRTYAPQPRRFTGRATILSAVLIALALAYTYPVRVYLNQQSDIARMEAEQQAQREEIGELSRQAARWQDEDYIRIQAKERFYMVAPDEKPLVVLFDPAGAAEGDARPEVSPPPADPWYDTLWSSVRAANEGTGS